MIKSLSFAGHQIVDYIVHWPTYVIAGPEVLSDIIAIHLLHAWLEKGKLSCTF
jgi:hypothetical protein